MSDDREAVLLKLAADQGHALAQTKLGLFYERGLAGLPPSRGRLMLTVLGGLAEFERELIRAARSYNVSRWTISRLCQ